MSIETWSGRGKPSGDGWVLTGYNEVRSPNPKSGSGYTTRRVPIYIRGAAGDAQATASSNASGTGSFPNALQSQLDDAKAAITAARERQVAPFSSAATAQGSPSGLTVEQLYQQILGRAPESQAVIDYWNNSFGDTIDAREAGVFAQAAKPELLGQVKPPTTGSNGSAGLTVENLYEKILGRAPESQEVIDYWNNSFGDTIDDREAGVFAQAAAPELMARVKTDGGQGKTDPEPDPGTTDDSDKQTTVNTRQAPTADNTAAAALEALRIQLGQQNDALRAQAAQQATFLQQSLQRQQEQYTAQLEQSRQQQVALQAQVEEQRRQAQALQRAFVPNLEPTAAAPAIGDARRTGRRAVNNTLSTLAVLTGANGTGPSSSASVLAGLQIA